MDPTTITYVKGDRVAVTNGHFGTLADVVVDSDTHRVKHLVVDPAGDHRQRRLVPVWLVTAVPGGLRIELDEAHARQLQRALTTDFLRVPTNSRGGATQGFKSVLREPYFEDDGLRGEIDNRGNVGIPTPECEIRRGSTVASVNDRLLGSVEGFIVRAGFVQAVVVHPSLHRHRADRVVPIVEVNNVYPDLITLHIDRDEFRRLPTTNVVPSEARFPVVGDVAPDTAQP